MYQGVPCVPPSTGGNDDRSSSGSRRRGTREVVTFRAFVRSYRPEDCAIGDLARGLAVDSSARRLQSSQALRRDLPRRTTRPHASSAGTRGNGIRPGEIFASMQSSRRPE
jgi:hypothetical protein